MAAGGNTPNSRTPSPPVFVTPGVPPQVSLPSLPIPPVPDNPNAAAAETGLALAKKYAESLTSAVATIIPPEISATFIDVPDAPDLINENAPTLQDVLLIDVSPPNTNIGFLDAFFSVDAAPAPPATHIGGIPALNAGPVPTAPTVNVVDVLPDPTVTLPQVPALLSLNVASFEGVTLPTFSATAPVVDLAEPTIAPYAPGAPYTSQLLTALKAELERRITDGGTGLAPAIEQAIWDRARERETKALQDALDDLERMESLGYAAPPGVYMDARLKIRTEYGKVETGLSRDIAIEQAKLELENVKIALAQSVDLERTLIDYANKIEQRVFETAKYTTEAGVQVYNAKVDAYRARVDAYRATVQVYEAQIRGEQAKVDVYRAQIAAEQAKAEINTALVQQYKVQVDAALSAIDIFKAKVDKIRVSAEIEKLKVEIFGEQVRAYAARINAYTAEVEGFKATVQADAARQDGYRSQIEAYKARVDAVAKGADVRIAEYRARAEVYRAEWDGYKSRVDAEVARARARTDMNASVIDAYKARQQVVVAYNDSLTKQWQVAVEYAGRVAEIATQTAKVRGDLYLTTRSIVADASKVAAQVAAQLAAAAMNSVSVSASVSGSLSASMSASSASSVSTSASENTSASGVSSDSFNYTISNDGGVVDG